MHYDERAPIPDDRFAMIIGAMKCGTTSLFEWLAVHPEIAPCVLKEPEWFSRGFGRTDGVPDYRRLWRFEPGRHAWALEASPGYTKIGQDHVPGAIKAAGLSPRFIYLIRDPFDRIVSHYDFMRNDPGWDAPLDGEPLIRASDYHRHADAFASVFGREALLVLTLDALRADRLGTLNRICDFLGIAPFGEAPVGAARNQTPPPPSDLERRLQRALPAVKRALPKPARDAITRTVRPLLGSKAELTARQHAAIKAELAPGMAKLAEEYGIDVAAWGFGG